MVHTGRSGIRQNLSSQESKREESGFILFGEGKILLQAHKTNHTKRMLMRDATGIKLVVNMKVEPGMKFTKTSVERKGKDMAQFVFVGINDTDRGYEHCRIVCPPDVGEQLYQKLTELRAIE